MLKDLILEMPKYITKTRELKFEEIKYKRAEFKKTIDNISSIPDIELADNFSYVFDSPLEVKEIKILLNYDEQYKAIKCYVKSRIFFTIDEKNKIQKKKEIKISKFAIFFGLCGVLFLVACLVPLAINSLTWIISGDIILLFNLTLPRIIGYLLLTFSMYIFCIKIYIDEDIAVYNANKLLELTKKIEIK